MVSNVHGGYDVTELHVPEEWMRWDNESGRWVLREDDESGESDDDDLSGNGAEPGTSRCGVAASL